MNKMNRIFGLTLILWTLPIWVYGQVDYLGVINYSPIYFDYPAVGNFPSGNEWLHYIYHRSTVQYWATDDLLLVAEGKLTLLKQSENGRVLLSSAVAPKSGTEFIDLSYKNKISSSLEFETSIQRLFFQFSKKEWIFTVGRQRITWGTNLVWNPIDIFNPRPPISIDNNDLPNADAVRAQWFFSPTSVIEFSIFPDVSRNELIAAGLVKVNWAETDWILMGGHRKGIPVIGGGFSGSLFEGGFRGEFILSAKSYRRDSMNELGIVNDERFSFAISGDYTFQNSLYLHSEILYHSKGKTKDILFGQLDMSDNFELSASRWSLFYETSFQLSALWRGQWIGIINPLDRSWIAGPSATFNAAEQWDFFGTVLFSSGDSTSEYGSTGTSGMVGLRFSF